MATAKEKIAVSILIKNCFILSDNRDQQLNREISLLKETG